LHFQILKIWYILPVLRTRMVTCQYFYFATNIFMHFVLFCHFSIFVLSSCLSFLSLFHSSLCFHCKFHSQFLVFLVFSSVISCLVFRCNNSYFLFCSWSVLQWSHSYSCLRLLLFFQFLFSFVFFVMLVFISSVFACLSFVMSLMVPPLSI